MTSLVVCIWISLFCCSWAIKEPTVPDENFVYKNTPWETEHNLPISDPNDELCGIWVNLTAKWQLNKAPQSKGTSKIAFKFEHPNFKETKKYTMEIQHDRKETKKAINICFSKCPITSTELTKQTFTLHATTDDIQEENAINVKVSSQESYDEECYIRYEIKDKTNWTFVFVAAIFSVGVTVVGVLKYSFDRWGSNATQTNSGRYGDLSDHSEIPLQGSQHGLDNGSTGVPNNDLIADRATSNGAASGAGPDEIIIKSARDDRRSGRARKPHKK